MTRLSHLWSAPFAWRPASGLYGVFPRASGDLLARMSATLHVGLSGRFQLIKRRASDDSIVETREFKNLITDAGLNRWGSGAVVDRCIVGSGNTTPAATDGQLASRVATSTTVQNPAVTFAYSAAERWQEYSTGYRFAAGTATGTLAEVGMGWADTGLWSRALIRDTQGNPTSLTLLADEYLDVFYTVRLQFPAADATGTVTLGGTSYTWTMRPANLQSGAAWGTLFGYPLAGHSASYEYASAYTGDLVATANATPTGSMSNFGGPYSVAPYIDGVSAGSFYRDFSTTSAAGKNTGNIKTVVFSLIAPNGGMQLAWQCAFTPAIPKTNTQTLKLTLRVSWERA